uniref:Uncharacterized protein n=1 Tax=Setaria digitata TaxID=48799 RepID=A0A915PIA8_9BILA
MKAMKNEIVTDQEILLGMSEKPVLRPQKSGTVTIEQARKWIILKMKDKLVQCVTFAEQCRSRVDETDCHSAVERSVSTERTTGDGEKLGQGKVRPGFRNNTTREKARDLEPLDWSTMSAARQSHSSTSGGDHRWKDPEQFATKKRKRSHGTLTSD